MDKQLVWQERYNIGVDFIDKEHKKLFSILNRLFKNKGEEEKSRWACQEGIKYFKEHAVKHFTEEEVHMASINYIEFDTHRRLHDNFRKKTLPALERELMQTNYGVDSINHFLGVCAGWLIGHTLIEDRAITGKTMSKWGNLLPEEQQVAMQKEIIQLLYDLFQLKARTVSDCYGGEKFGHGIYYRLVYGSKENEKWEIVLAFEEKLILGTIGGIMDVQPDTMDVMLMNIVRYTAQQLVNRIREHYPSADLFEMKEENLLTYEQFQKIFDKNSPQFSLLFDTGLGYFAHSVIAPHLIQSEAGPSIKAENAMTEIKKYLDESKASPKRKILLVDDSDFVLQAMKELLGTDYEVALAKSGMAAIRCMTLNRPDLVMLDYDMPICDGSQVLEMIRSEEEFADIPVIFLTGRVDKESVKKVVALKPAGYLSKTLPPAEIKKGVDGYFKV